MQRDTAVHGDRGAGNVGAEALRELAVDVVEEPGVRDDEDVLPLDEGQDAYVEKIRALIDVAKINTLTVLIMQVPAAWVC